MYGGPFWWFWSWEVSVTIGIYTIALWGLIWLLKKVEERLWSAEKLRNFRSNSPTEPAQQRNLENRISQLLWQLLWYPGSWVIIYFRGSGRYYIHSTCLIRSVARKFVEMTFFIWEVRNIGIREEKNGPCEFGMIWMCFGCDLGWIFPWIK